jgi:hypothetical protein
MAQQHVEWQYPVPDVQLAPVVGADGTVYVLAQDGTLTAVGTDGLPKWQYSAQEAASDGPVMGPEGNLYYTTPTRLVAVSSAGQALWNKTIDNGTKFAPTVAPDGTVAVLAGAVSLVAFTAQGASAWTYTLELTPGAQPDAGPDGVFYIPYKEGSLAAIKAGTKAWSYDNVGENPTAPAAGANGLVAVWTPEPALLLFDAQGQLVWGKNPTYTFTTNPVLGPDGTVYVGGSDGALHAFSKTDGTDTPVVPSSSPTGKLVAPTAQSLFFTGADNSVYIVQLGPPVSSTSQKMPGPVNSVVVAPSGRLYAVLGHTGGVNMLTLLSSETPTGTVWQASGLQNLSVYKLVQQPDAPKVFLAGTSGGIYRSEDSGATWAPTAIVGDSNMTVTEIDVANGGAGYAVVNNIVASSPDGTQWSQGQKLDASDLAAADPKDPKHAFVGATETTAVWETKDGGQGFDAYGVPLDSLKQLFVSSKGGVYAVTGGGVSSPGDGSVVLPGGWTYVSVLPDHATMYALGVNKLAISADGGATWQPQDVLLPGALWRLAPDPANPKALTVATVVPTTTKGTLGAQGINLYRSEDGGKTWALFNRGLPTLNVYSLVPEASGSLLLGTAQGVWKIAVGGGTVPPPTVVKGDLNGNGKVDVADAIIALKIVAGLSPAPTAAQLAAGDVAPLGNPDGKITVQDVVLILKRVVGLIPSL